MTDSSGPPLGIIGGFYFAMKSTEGVGLLQGY